MFLIVLVLFSLGKAERAVYVVENMLGMRFMLELLLVKMYMYFIYIKERHER